MCTEIGCVLSVWVRKGESVDCVKQKVFVKCKCMFIVCVRVQGDEAIVINSQHMTLSLD